jgi:endonuclease/exonuclease/phosphatase family metal-dependent hydrolase
MKGISGLFTLLAVFALAAAAQQRVRFLTYNIHHAEGTDAKIDIERIANVILSADPDFVAVQEVDVRTTRVGTADQAEQLRGWTGLHSIFGRTINYRGGWYGNALLSRWPVNGFVNHAMPFTPGREQRGVIEAVIQPPPDVRDGHGFHALATHLDTGENDRLLAAERLHEIVAERPPDWPMILAGDMNAARGSRTLESLERDWTVAWQGEPLLSFPSEAPNRWIDFILYRPANRWKVFEVKVIGGGAASDHLPVLAVLELMPPE